jgi:hypothetical protein
VAHDTAEATPPNSQAPRWVIFAWCRLAVLVLVASTLALLALQLVFDAVNNWGMYGRSARDSITEVSLGLLPLLVPAAVIAHRRRRRYAWIRTLRAAFWVMLIVAVLPAYFGAMTSVA